MERESCTYFAEYTSYTDYTEWIKGRLALNYLRECLVQCADEVSKEEHNRILKNIGLTPGSSCNICDLKTLKPKHADSSNTSQCTFDISNCNCLRSDTKSCPNNICDRIYEEIIALRGQRQVYWYSTDIKQWTTNPWEITKCYINDPGYKGKSAADTDLLVLMQLLRSSQLLDYVDTMSKKIQDFRNRTLPDKKHFYFKDRMNDLIMLIIDMLEQSKRIMHEECVKHAVQKLRDLYGRSFIITTNIEMEVCNAELAHVIKKIESRTKQEDFNPETCKAVVDRQTQFSTDSIEELRSYRNMLTDHIRTIKNRMEDIAMLPWKSKAKRIHLGSDLDLKELVESDEILAPVLTSKRILDIHVPQVARQLSLSRNSILRRKIKLVLELTNQDDLPALFEDIGITNQDDLPALFEDIGITNQDDLPALFEDIGITNQDDLPALFEDTGNIIEASEETSFKTPTEQMKNAHGESDWEHYVTSGDELALFHLMRKNNFIPNSLQLTYACKRFGRKSRIMRIICNLICKFIKASAEEIITVWPAYREQNTQDITFVIVSPNKIRAEKFSDINVLYRNPENKGFEHRDVIRTAVDSNVRIEEDDMNFMKVTINSHSEFLRNKHSNITAITGSPLRSLGYQKGTHATKKEICIVLLVPIKGLIPLQEDPFPKQIGSFKIDVREGSFKWYVGGEPSDVHTELKMGCAIGPAERDVTGTLGGFVSHPEHGLCALTCAHVLMGEEEIMSKANIAWRRCVQPSNTYCDFGHVVKTIFRDDGPDKPGLDIALIKIDSRAPINGHFPDMDLGTLEKAGFSETNEIKYTSGKILSRIADRDCRVVKYGSQTTLRRGVLGFNGMELAYRPVRYSREIVLKNQIEILDITRCGPFAEAGDSGSLVFVVSGNELVAFGLLLGGDDGYAVVTPILDVLRAIQCDSMKEFSEMAVSQSDSGVYSDDREEMEVDTEGGEDELYNRLSRLRLQSTTDV